MKIRMLTNRKGSPDGIRVVFYRTGETYDLPPALALPWLEKGYCEQDKVLEPEIKVESASALPQTKKRRR